MCIYMCIAWQAYVVTLLDGTGYVFTRRVSTPSWVGRPLGMGEVALAGRSMKVMMRGPRWEAW